tara:strand:+ start:790 stop:978 length:189 start_codon:yes stop_codon:yes gene_type:complete
MRKPDTNLQKAMSAGYTLLGSFLILGGFGYYLSNKYDNMLWLIGLSILGIIVGMYELYKQMQ